jgi:hypothetical protein
VQKSGNLIKHTDIKMRVKDFSTGETIIDVGYEFEKLRVVDKLNIVDELLQTSYDQISDITDDIKDSAIGCIYALNKIEDKCKTLLETFKSL